MPVRSTWMSTSLMPTGGTGASSSHRPGSLFFLIKAGIVRMAGRLSVQLRRRALHRGRRFAAADGPVVTPVEQDLPLALLDLPAQRLTPGPAGRRCLAQVNERER